MENQKIEVGTKLKIFDDKIHFWIDGEIIKIFSHEEIPGVLVREISGFTYEMPLKHLQDEKKYKVL